MQFTIAELAEPEDAGWYLAAYAASTSSNKPVEVFGYYKIFGTPVESYFTSATCIAKGTAGAASNVTEAATLALAAARRRLERLQDGGEFVAWGELRLCLESTAPGA